MALPWSRPSVLLPLTRFNVIRKRGHPMMSSNPQRAAADRPLAGSRRPGRARSFALVALGDLRALPASLCGVLRPDQNASRRIKAPFPLRPVALVPFRSDFAEVWPAASLAAASRAASKAAGMPRPINGTFDQRRRQPADRIVIRSFSLNMILGKAQSSLRIQTGNCHFFTCPTKQGVL